MLRDSWLCPREWKVHLASWRQRWTKRNEMQQLSHLGTLYPEAKNLIDLQRMGGRVIDDHSFEFYKECLLFPWQDHYSFPSSCEESGLEVHHVTLRDWVSTLLLCNRANRLFPFGNPDRPEHMPVSPQIIFRNGKVGSLVNSKHLAANFLLSWVLFCF